MVVGRFAAACCGVLLAARIAGGLEPAAPGASASAEKPVKLIVDYGDGVQKHFTALAWKKDMTVLDAMQMAAEHPRGITFEYRGRGSTALLVRIDNVKNEGAGRNWIYRVNGKLADRSMGVWRLQPGDTILWSFAEYQ